MKRLFLLVSLVVAVFGCRLRFGESSVSAANETAKFKAFFMTALKAIAAEMPREQSREFIKKDDTMLKPTCSEISGGLGALRTLGTAVIYLGTEPHFRMKDKIFQELKKVESIYLTASLKCGYGGTHDKISTLIEPTMPMLKNIITLVEKI